MAMSDSISERTLFGHPRGLTWLFTTEMWERFSYYGMRALLVLYLTKFLFAPDNFENVIGYHLLHNLLQSLFGQLDAGSVVNATYQPQFASLIYGFYTGFVYLTPFFGGIVADRWLGQRRSVIVGGITMAIAEFTLMSPSLLFIGLFLLIVGNGFFKPNISTQVGNLYKPGDSRIDRAYSIFYVGINVGAFFSPLVCGTLGEHVAWKWGFFAAGIGMVIGQLIYIVALRTLPDDRIARLKHSTEGKKPLTASDWKAVVALILLCVPTTLFWATYEQQGNTINLWAANFTDRRLIPGIIDWQIDVTWFQSFNPFMIFAFTPLVVWFWGRQAEHGKEPRTVIKMALGNFLLALSYVVMAAAAYLTGPTGHASWLWLFVFFTVITLGELYLSPIGLALVARVAPAQILSAMMGLWFITSFTGNLLEGYIGTFFSTMDKVSFFLLCAGLGLLAAIVTWAFDRPLRSILDGTIAKPDMVPEPQADAGAARHPAQ
jgi:POT family proton-dependent oligopeptide transporter